MHWETSFEYNNKGLVVITAMRDGQFDPVWGLLGSTDLNNTAALEHVPKAEHKIRVVKKRCCALKSTLPFMALPARLVIGTIIFVLMVMNTFQMSYGITDIFSLWAFMIGMALDFKKHCRVHFGMYFQQSFQN